MKSRRPARREAPHLRRTTMLVLLLAACFSLAALVWQWIDWDGLEREDLGVVARLVPVFWSPYLGLALLALWLDRRPLRAVVVLAGSVLVVLWGVYWHLEALVRPSAVSQIVAPLLITGNQWMGVVGTAILALAAGLIPSRATRRRREGI